MLLNGHHIAQSNLWKRDLTEFWDLYERVDADHPVFTEHADRSCTIPYFLHGDEGRGGSKSPILVLSFQGLFSHFGKSRLNESGFQAMLSISFILFFSSLYTNEVLTGLMFYTIRTKAFLLFQTSLHCDTCSLLQW